MTQEQPDRVLWIAAVDEPAAMRLPLRELRNRRDPHKRGEQRNIG